jgi:hypothetical protein
LHKNGFDLDPGMVIVLESTTFPGATREMLLSRFADNAQGWQMGEDFFLAFSPERVDPGRTDWTTHNMPKGDRRGDAGVSGRDDGRGRSRQESGMHPVHDGGLQHQILCVMIEVYSASSRCEGLFW